MKNLLAILTIIFSITVNAQDVTKFLGIPVDGSKSEMIQKLKAKGFRELTYEDETILEGEFNGHDVNVYIVTNKNKVYRIMVCDANTVDARSIQIRFNNLCEQFKNNPKYFSAGDYTIPDKEDIPYEMTVHDKRYEAVFYQQPEVIDTTAISDNFTTFLTTKYTKEELENPTEELRSEIKELTIDYAMDLLSKKPVWFMISNLFGEYYITMYYDNVYNQAQGEDL